MIRYPRPALLADFCRFARAQILSGDIDPMYAVLKRFYAAERLSPEVALWRTALYLTWYHVGTAETVWRAFPTPDAFLALPEDATRAGLRGLATGTERRAFRGNDLAHRFLRRLLERAWGRGGSLGAWVAYYAHAGGTAGWDAVRDELQQVPYAGPWASYKWADLLKHVHDVDITASSIGDKLGETAGPIPGMVQLTGLSWRVCAESTATQIALMGDCIENGVPFSGLDQLETCLCDFNSLLKGGYYVGHDIDQQMTQLQHSSPGLWEAREAFPLAYRGEFGGWVGVRKELRRAYVDRKELVNL